MKQSRRWRVRHTRKTLAVTVLLLLCAVTVHVLLYRLLAVVGIKRDDFFGIVLVMVFGCAVWFWPFYYAFCRCRIEEIPSSENHRSA
jgi:hypothetical protein